MIKIYDKNETDFKHNGICILDSCIRGEVEEELNGIYKLELEYPIDARGKWLNIVEGNIIKAPTPMGYQLFRIFKKKKNLTTISCVALHIFYDLLDNFLEDVRPTDMTGASALETIFKNTQYPNKFFTSSDISNFNTAYYIRKNPVEALLSDDENSFLNRWGGEIVRDNFNISMKAHRGEDKGVQIRYGKNLIGLEEEIDESNVVTRIMPTGLYENDTVLILPEKYIDSPLIGKYTYPKIKHIHYTDFKINNSDDPKEKVTKDDVIRMLREKIKELYEVEKVDLPVINYKIDFVQLSKTEEYKDYQILERVWIADVITVKHEKLDINLKSKVIKYKFDCISKRYIEIQLGNFIKNITNSMQEQEKNLNIINNKIDTNVSNLKQTLNETAKIIKENTGSLDNAIKNATEILNNALGGHVVKRNGELLIMDTDNIQTATKVWKWNVGGLGYSNNGYNGKYETAITMDGHIVGKFLAGERIRGVILEGAEIISCDNPDWGGNLEKDFWKESKNVCKLRKGGMLFESRENVASVFNPNLKVEIDGYGIKTRKDDTFLEFAPSKKYGRGELELSGTTIVGNKIEDVPESGGIIIQSKEGIYFDTSEIYVYPNKLKVSDTLSQGIIGEIKQIKNDILFGEYICNLKPTSWCMLNFMNGWSDYMDNIYGTPSWCIDSSGFLHLKGMVKGGSIGSIIAKLPYIPEEKNQIFTTISGKNQIARIDVEGNGDIKFMYGNNNFISLAPISFRVKGW